MEFELTRRRCLPSIILALTMFVVFCLSACDPHAGKYPFQKAECWISDDPAISLCYIQNDDQTRTSIEELYWNDETIKIDVGMQSNYYCVYPATSTHYDDRLFEGRWKYRRGNLVLKIEEDFIFNNQYSEIVLVPTATE